MNDQEKQQKELEAWAKETYQKFQFDFGQPLETPFALNCVENILNKRMIEWIKLRVDHFDSPKLLAFYEILLGKKPNEPTSSQGS